MGTQAQKFLDEIKQDFPDLILKHIESGQAIFEGSIAFSADYVGKGLIEDQFEVEISLPMDNSGKLPSAKETSGRIPKDFHHNGDGTLCLGAPLEVRRKYAEQPSLEGFIKKLLVPYLYSFSYRGKYGEMPFGELPHGGQGIVDYYKEILDTDSELVVFELLKIIIEDNYRGHIPCLCGSQIKLRNCHGKLIREIKEIQDRKDFLYDFLCCLRVYEDSGNKLNKNFLTKRFRSYVKKVSPED